jgi:ABC-2 type transport system permease protein
MLAQSILFRDAGFDIVWPQFLALLVISFFLFVFALARFRSFLK